MRIAFVYNLQSYWGEGHPPDLLDRDYPNISIAGGETYMLELAFGVAAAGHDVRVYSRLVRPSVYKGVEFLPLEAFDADKPEVVLAVMHPQPLTASPPSAVKLLLQQVNHLDYGFPWAYACDGVVAASAVHAIWLGRQGVWSGQYYVVHNGCHVTRYVNAPPLVTRQPLVGYWSSPDRGLHNLLWAWPLVVRERPDARLRVHYEIEKLLRIQVERDILRGWNPQIDGRLDELREAVNSVRKLSSVQFTGMLSKGRMIAAQKQTRVMCYPCDPIGFTEGFGQSCAEGLAAGCLVMLHMVDALPSLFTGGVVEIQSLKAEPLAQQVLQALDMTERPKEADAIAAHWSWDNSVQELLTAIKQVQERKQNG